MGDEGDFWKDVKAHEQQNAAPPANSVGVVSRPEIGASRGPEEATAGGSAPSTTEALTGETPRTDEAIQLAPLPIKPLVASHLRDFAEFLPAEKREDFNATIDDLLEALPRLPQKGRS